MNIEIRPIQKSDYDAAIQFAIKGMHFDWYLNSRFLLNAYGRYFWYLEMNHATHVFAAYADGNFAGILLAEIYGEKRSTRFGQNRSMSKSLTQSKSYFSAAALGSMKIPFNPSYNIICVITSQMEKSSFWRLILMSRPKA